MLSAPTTEDAVARINDLIAELKTSHTGLFTPDDYRYYITLEILNGAPATRDLIFERFWGTGPYFAGIGIFTADVDGRHFIDGVLEGSPADRAGLKYGDEVITADGQPFSLIAAFRGKIGASVELMVRRARDAEPMRVVVPVIPIVPSVAFADAARASARVIEKNGRRIGYVHLWSINELRSLRAALSALQGSIRASPTRPGRRSMRWSSTSADASAATSVPRAQMLEMLGTAPKPYWGALQFVDRAGNRNSARAMAAHASRPLFEGRRRC